MRALSLHEHACLLALCRRQAHLCWLSASLKAAWTALWPPAQHLNGQLDLQQTCARPAGRARERIPHLLGTQKL